MKFCLENTQTGYTCFIDNKSLHDNVHSTKSVSEKILQVDIASIKQMIQRKELFDFNWVP